MDIPSIVTVKNAIPIVAISEGGDETLALQAVENVRRAVRIQETSNLQYWFGGSRRIEINEDVIGMGSYGKTLTVLYGIAEPDADDEEDEESLIESWTPRF